MRKGVERHSGERSGGWRGWDAVHLDGALAAGEAGQTPSRGSGCSLFLT